MSRTVRRTLRLVTQPLKPSAWDTCGNVLGALKMMPVAAAELPGRFSPGQHCDSIQEPVFDTAGWRSHCAVLPE